MLCAAMFCVTAAKLQARRNAERDAACFNKAKREMDTANPKHFSVACPDAAGNEVVIYHFEQTRTGWKFTGLDNINE